MKCCKYQLSFIFRFPTLPDNWGPKAAARMKLNGEVELEARKERRERKRGVTKAQAEAGGDGLTKRARIRENKRQKRLKKSEEKKDEIGVNEATVES